MLVLGLLPACAGAQPPPAAEEAPSSPPPKAHVRAVEVTGAPGTYHFSVTIESPDRGCDQYADWWEVLDGDGGLLYRRILRHSHVDEQPFTRAGGPVEAAADRVLVVRAHLRTTGFGGQAMRGTPAGGFAVVTDLPADFATGVEGLPPRPEGCLY
jgi:hypothetical protein